MLREGSLIMNPSGASTTSPNISLKQFLLCTFETGLFNLICLSIFNWRSLLVKSCFFPSKYLKRKEF